MSTTTSYRKPTSVRLRPSERRVMLLAGDFIAAVIALFVSIFFWANQDWLDYTAEFFQQRVPGWFYLLPLLWLVLMVEMYDIRRAARRGDTIRGVALAGLISLLLYLFVFFFSEPNSLPRRGVAAFVAAVVVLTLAWRFFYIQVFTTSKFMRRALVIGAGRAGSALVKVIHESWPTPFLVVGLIDDDPQKLGIETEGYKVLGTSAQLQEIIDREGVTDLIFAISGEMDSHMVEALLQAEENGVEMTTMPTLYQSLLGRVPIFLLQSDWILRTFFDQAHVNSLYEIGKRVIDIIGGLMGSLITLALFPFIALATLLDSGFPVFFSQSRLGKNGQEFNIIKFRTMVKDAEKDGVARTATTHDSRITRVGNILRKSHLDELPQFFNVLKGEMSLVGPRAERAQLVNDLQTKLPFYRARLLVKPGITGWAQVNFGYAETVDDMAIKLEYDLYYIMRRSLGLDLIIILRTVGTVIGFRGR